MIDNKDSSSPEFEGTSIDLGDDLLEKTAIFSTHSNEVRGRDGNDVHSGPGKIDDLLHSAQILLNEGLIEDAKKTLHSILILDRENIEAQHKLGELHELELKQLFGAEKSNRPSSRKFLSQSPSEFDYTDPSDSHGEVIDTDALIQQLDQDLNLGLSLESNLSFKPARRDGILTSLTEKLDHRSLTQEISIESLALFQDKDKRLIDEFCQKLEADLDGDSKTASVRDWIDLGIAFLEMEIYSIAIRLFEGACRRFNLKPQEDIKLFLSAISLLGFSLLLAGKPLEAISKIEPILYDADVQKADKIDLLYLMGRVYETQGRLDLAGSFYGQVNEIDPEYRDVDRRLALICKA